MRARERERDNREKIRKQKGRSEKREDKKDRGAGTLCKTARKREVETEG